MEQQISYFIVIEPDGKVSLDSCPLSKAPEAILHPDTAFGKQIGSQTLFYVINATAEQYDQIGAMYHVIKDTVSYVKKVVKVKNV